MASSLLCIYGAPSSSLTVYPWTQTQNDGSCCAFSYCTILFAANSLLGSSRPKTTASHLVRLMRQLMVRRTILWQSQSVAAGRYSIWIRLERSGSSEDSEMCRDSKFLVRWCMNQIVQSIVERSSRSLGAVRSRASTSSTFEFKISRRVSWLVSESERLLKMVTQRR